MKAEMEVKFAEKEEKMKEVCELKRFLPEYEQIER
jgi:hypothetical protein